MLKLSEIGKLSKQFANTCCYKNLQSHILAARKCCPISSSIGPAGKTANEPIRIKQRAGLCQLGRNDIRCCTKCNEINQCIWSASKNSSFYVPDQATPWYEKQRDSRLNRHTLLEQCQCYGISSFVPPEECLRLRARECMKPLDANKYKRISPEFLNLLQNYEYLMARYDPVHDRSGYCKRPAQVFAEPAGKSAKARSQSEGKGVSYAKASARSKTPQDAPEPLRGGHPKVHGFERPAVSAASEEKVQNAKKSAAKAKDTKNATTKHESSKTAVKPSESLASNAASTSKAAKQGKNEKKRWSLKAFSKENKEKKESKTQKVKSKPAKNSPVRELWSKPNAAEMRESGGSIEMHRGKSKQRGVRDINNDTYDEADTSLIKLRPQVRYHAYTTTAHEQTEQSRGRRGKFLSERSSSKQRSVSDREASDALVETKPRVHGIFNDSDTLTEKKRSSPKTSNCRKLWSSRSASSEREQLTKGRSHSLHSKASATELNPTVHGYSQYRDVGRYSSSTPKPRRKQSASPTKCRIPSDRDDDSDTVSLAPRVHKLRSYKHTHNAYATTCKRLASPPPPPPIKSCKRSAAKRAPVGSLAPRVHAYKDNQRNTKPMRERSLSTAAESSSCGRRTNTRTYHTQAVRTRSPLSTSRGRAPKKAISTSASTDSLAPRLHGYQLRQTGCSQREKYTYSASRNQHETRKHRKSPSNSDSMASIGPPEIHGYGHEQPKNRVALVEAPHKKSLRYEASPMKIKPEHSSSVSKFKSAVYMRPGLHGYRNHALAEVDEDVPAKKNAQLPSSTAQDQQELSQQKQQPYSSTATMTGQAKRKPPKHTTIAAFTAHVQYNPDKQNLYHECTKSSSALSINSPHRSCGSSSPLSSDDSSHPFNPKLKTCLSRNLSKNRCSNCQAQKQHCLCDPSKNDPRLQQLQKIHHHQDYEPEQTCELPNAKSTKYVHSSSILRKCFPAQAAQSDTGLSSECEERCIRFSDTSHKISKQSCCAEKEQANACALPIKQPETHIQCGYMSDLSKFKGDEWPNDRQMESDDGGSKSSQECDEECRRRKNALKNAPRGDTSPNAKRHENCYRDAINWSYANERFPSRYRLQGEKAAEEAYQLERHKARNRSKSRICSPSSEEENEGRVSAHRHKACSRDAYDWSEATKNYPIRYQQAAQDAADERAWRQKHMKKMHSMSQCSSQAEDRHTLCSRDAYDWSEVTENYPMRYQQAAARQEADRVMLERHTARRRSKSPNPQPGVCQERHNACFNDSTDWRNATVNYPIRYRIAALEAATGRKFHTRPNLREHSSSPNSSPSRSPNRRRRNPSRNTSPVNRSRTPSPSRKEDNAADRGYRPQIHGQNYQDIPAGTKRSRSPKNRAESKQEDLLRRRYPTRYQTQQQQPCRSRDKSPVNSDDNEPPQQRFKVAAGGYYKSPSYLSDPSKSRIPIANKYSPLKQSNSSQKETDNKMRAESNAGKENKPAKRKVKEESICTALRPDYILGQRQTFRG